MIHITLHPSESLFFLDTDKICVARELYLDRQNKTVRVITSVKDKTYPADNIGAMRQLYDGSVFQAPICEFDFLDEF